MSKFTIADLRKERGESLAEFAIALGLASKGHASDIENGKSSCSFQVALTLETLSSGRLNAAVLNKDVALARQQAA